jgi:hypothetical protein
MFLRSLLGTSVIAAAPKVVYVFAPPGGWNLTDGQVWASNSSGNSLWLNKTPTEILADFNYALTQVWVNSELLVPGQFEFNAANLKILDPKLVQALRTKRDKEWFL